MQNTTTTVEGPNGTQVTGTVTDVTGTGQVWEITSGTDVYERCPISGRFYPKK